MFENIYENTCGWKSALKYMKYYLKTENGCLKIQTKLLLDSSLLPSVMLLDEFIRAVGDDGEA